MSQENPLFVARPEDVASVQNLWNEARSGAARVVRLQAPFGGGRRALVAEFLRGVRASGDDALVWRVTCMDQENGVQWLVRMYGSLMAQISGDALLRGRVEMLLNAQLPNQTRRVQNWFQLFANGLKEAKTDANGQIQLRLPQDNPLIGLVEIAVGISRKMPLIIDIQGLPTIDSLLPAQFLEGIYDEARQGGGKLLVLVHDEPESDATRAMYPMPLLDVYKRRADDLTTLAIAPWGEAEVSQHLASKGLEGDAARLAAIAGGRPGFIAELIDILAERGELGGDLSAVTLASLTPLSVDEEELDVPDEPPEEGKRKHADASDAGRVAYFGALLGQAFPSALVADLGGWDRESIDDLVDAMGDLFEEVQFSEELGTWIYKFRRGSWREGLLEQNASDEGHELARRVGLYIERFLVPRGYGFISKACRIYAEHGAGQRASIMRSLALTRDAADAWGLAYDFMKYFDELKWPDPLVRTVFMNLLDGMVGSGPVEATEKVHAEATAWATEREDRELTAWLLFAGSKLDARRQDFYRARDRAHDAIKLFTALENKARVAEIYNHLASIELQDGNPNAALEQVGKALQFGQTDGPDGQRLVIPAVFAHAEFIRGHVSRRSGKLEEALAHFQRANDVASQAGLGPVALDAGLGLGETLLASRQTEQARDVLRRVTQASRQVRHPLRERTASELLAQAEAGLRNFEAAIPLQTRVLQLSQQLRFEQALPLDLYHLGFFHFAAGKPGEAVTFLRQAEQRIGSLGKHPVLKELYYFLGLSCLRTGAIDEGKAALRKGLGPMREAKDWAKVVSSIDNLAQAEIQTGNKEAARKLLEDGIEVAKNANLKDEKKVLRKRLESIDA